MRIGVNAPECRGLADPAAIRAAANAAEQVGYASVWLADRAGGLDPVALLAAAATVTTRIRLGVSVFVVPWYRPVLLARSLAALDQLSDGRVTFALGLGRSSDEARLVGVDPRPRAQRLEELLDVLDAAAPPGRPRPPLLIGGSSAAGRDRVARRADGWHPAGVPIADLARMWGEIRDRAAGYGRDPDRLELVVRADLTVTDDPVDGDRADFCGSVDQIAGDLDEARRAGAHEVLLAVPSGYGFDHALDTYARLAEALAGGPAQVVGASSTAGMPIP